MSVKVADRVWKHSKQEGSALVMLLAIADFANDDGFCWPSIPTLAERCRMSTRQAQRVIRKLIDAGELAVNVGAGRGNTSLYKVILEKGDMDDTFNAEKVTSGAEKVTSGAEKVTSRVVKGDIAMSPDPLEPSIEPSRIHRARDTNRDIFAETGSKALVDWWLKLIGGGLPRDPMERQSRFFGPAENLLQRLDGDVLEARELLEAKRAELIREQKTPKYLDSVIFYVVADLDRPGVSAEADTWGSDAMVWSEA